MRGQAGGLSLKAGACMERTLEGVELYTPNMQLGCIG